MDVKLTVAIVAAVGSFVAALISTIGVFATARLNRTTQRQVEELRDRLSQKAADKNALRDYEYEARQRLYKECEPAIFRFLEECDSARTRIATLARLSRSGELADGDDPWIKHEDNRLSTLYRLVSPVAAYALLQDKLTLFDLSLEPRIYLQYQVGKMIAESFSNDFSLSIAGRSLPYHPDNALDDSETAPAIYNRQGISIEHLEALTSAIIEQPREARQLMSYPRFNQLRKDRALPLVDAILNVDYFLRDFTPQERPVLWRVLIVQALLYGMIMRTFGVRSLPGNISELFNAAVDEATLYEACDDNAAMNAVTLGAAVAFLRPRIDRMQRLLKLTGGPHEKIDQ